MVKGILSEFPKILSKRLFWNGCAAISFGLMGIGLVGSLFGYDESVGLAFPIGLLGVWLVYRLARN